jgi:hypothetical protein
MKTDPGNQSTTETEVVREGARIYGVELTDAEVEIRINNAPPNQDEE